MRTKLLFLFGFFAMQLSLAKTETLTVPILINVQPLTYCDPNNDGFGVFDLTQVTPQILAAQSGAASNYQITYQETFGSNTISNPGAYYNIHPDSQTIYYTIVEISSGDAAIGSFQVVVNPRPIATHPSDIALCDYDQDGLTAFDFTILIPEILGTLNPASTTVSFYTSQAAAESGVSPIIPINSYVGSNGQTIWVRVEDNATGCFDVVSFHLFVNVPLALTIPATYAVCDDDAYPNNQYTTFDLTVKNNEITQALSGYTVTYYPSFIDAQTGTNAIAAPWAYTNIMPAIQTLGVRVTSPQGCASYTTLDIRVYPVPTPNTNPPALAPQCDVNNPGDMMEVFDLTANEGYITNGDPNLTFHYYQTMSDAIANANEILTPTAALVGGNVWIRVENNFTDYHGDHCYVLVEQPLTVNLLPVINLVSNNTLNTVYVDGDNNVVQALTLDAQLTGNYSFLWQIDGAPIPVAGSPTYTVGTASPSGASRIVMVAATNFLTGCTAESSIVVLQSSGTPSPLGPIIQPFGPGDTLADLNISGVNVLWYAAASGKNTTTTNSTPLPLSTLLQNGTTYYASQTIGGIESIARLPVTVYAALGIPGNEITSLQFAPNPVKNSLTLQSPVIIKSVIVYTMLGQKVFAQNYNDNTINIDLSRLTTGNYILKAQGEIGEKTIRIIKE